MLKYVAFLLNTLALLIYQFFVADVITITQKIPATAKAETEFMVELTIKKGTTVGFAKLQQDLPEGFTAVVDQANGASFTFSNQSVKFIWMSLPNDKEFKISYKVKTTANVNGEQIIAGKFSYIADNVKQVVDITPATINITNTTSQPIATNNTTPTTSITPTPTPTVESTIAKETTTAITNSITPTETVVVKNTEPSSVICSRKMPENAAEEFTVEVSINKGNLVGFAKLIETLPAGFTATTIDSKGASFTFADQKVKYVWVSMPSAADFKVSYKVTCDAKTIGTQNIDGTFSYIENDDTKKFVIPTNTINISEKISSQPIAVNTNTTTVTETPKVEETKIEPVVEETKIKETEKIVAATTIPSPQGNVNYSVQIAALHNAKPATTLAGMYKISENVNTEMAEGFTKYTVGSHTEYKSARDAREEIKTKGVPNPWVTAYNSGKRITVQEALMVTSQKWYR